MPDPCAVHNSALVYYTSTTVQVIYKPSSAIIWTKPIGAPAQMFRDPSPQAGQETSASKFFQLITFNKNPRTLSSVLSILFITSVSKPRVLKQMPNKEGQYYWHVMNLKHVPPFCIEYCRLGFADQAFHIICLSFLLPPHRRILAFPFARGLYTCFCW